MLQSIRDGDRLIVRIDGELDHFCAQSVRRDLDALLLDRSVRTLILDFSSLTFMDSSGIAVLLRLWQRMEELEGTIQVTGLPDQPARVLRAAGIQRLIPLT